MAECKATLEFRKTAARLPRRKRLFTIATLCIAAAVGLLVFDRTRQSHSELKFVRHTTYGATHVAVFRLTCNQQRGELASPGEIFSGAACFPAHWITNFNAKFPSRCEKEFAVIAPYETTPWRLQLTFVQKPSDTLVKLRASWFLLKTRRTAAFSGIKTVWSKNASFTSRLSVMAEQSQFNKPSWQQIIASEFVPNTIAGH